MALKIDIYAVLAHNLGKSVIYEDHARVNFIAFRLPLREVSSGF